MTAKDIQRRLMIDRYRQSFVLPNYTPGRWFECDVFEITKAGYFREFEIKVSKSDFKADAMKEIRFWLNGSWQFHNKHTQLDLGNRSGPRQFWFVLPEGMDVEIPLWAGLMVARPTTRRRGPYAVSISEVKRAPILHKAKIDPAVEKHARGVTYWRFHQLINTGKWVDPEPASA